MLGLYISLATVRARCASHVPNCTTTLSFSLSQVRKTTQPSDLSIKSTVPNTSKSRLSYKDKLRKCYNADYLFYVSFA